MANLTLLRIFSIYISLVLLRGKFHRHKTILQIFHFQVCFCFFVSAWLGALPDRSEYCPMQIWTVRVGMEQGIDTKQGIVQVRLFISMYWLFFYHYIFKYVQSFAKEDLPGSGGISVKICEQEHHRK